MDNIAELTGAYVAEGSGDVEHLVRVIHALIEGLVMQRILTRELCPDEVFYAAFAALARR